MTDSQAPDHTRIRPQRWPIHRFLALGLLLTVVLSGCTVGGSQGPSVTPSVVTDPGSTGGVAPPRVVGDLADRIAVAWATVQGYRATTVQGSGDLSRVPLPAPPVSGMVPPDDTGSISQAVVDEVVLPDQRHYLESAGGAVSEFSAVGGRVYARGRFAQLAIRPDLDATTWVNLDPAFISPDSSIGQFLAGFSGDRAAAFRSPLADLQPDTRGRELTATGSVDVGGRPCAAYRWTDNGESGDAMTRVVSVDASGLPCSLEFTSGDYTSRVTWDAYNQIPPIVAPADWVTVGETLDMGRGSATPAAGTDGPASTPDTIVAPDATPADPATAVSIATPLTG